MRMVGGHSRPGMELHGSVAEAVEQGREQGGDDGDFANGFHSGSTWMLAAGSFMFIELVLIAASNFVILNNCIGSSLLSFRTSSSLALRWSIVLFSLYVFCFGYYKWP